MSRRVKKEVECAENIGLDELARTVDGTVDMAFGGEMHHRFRPVPCEDFPYPRSIAQVDLLEMVPRMVHHTDKRRKVPSVTKLVEIDDLVVGLIDEIANEV